MLSKFFLLDFENCKRSASYVANKLEKRGIILRKMETYNLKNKLRLTIGSNKENKQLIKNMNIILK